MPHGSRIQLWIAGSILLVAGSSTTGEERILRIGGPPATASRVPAWDARGTGLLPWQGIACIDLSEDGRFAAIGTIAPPGDPNVFLVDEQGKLSAQHEAGRRWIHEVAVTDDGFVAALCTTPTGEAGDRPLVRTFPGGDGDHVDPLIFHYGGHSNHLAPCLTAHGNEIAVLANGSIRWLSRGADSKRADATPVRNGAEAVAFAIAPVAAAGREASTPTRIAVALAASGRTVPAVEQNLLLMERGRRGPLWSRAPETAVAPAPPPEPGVYGPPAPPYEDIECRAPLSVAISNSGTRLAAADYQGWERWFADGQGLRFGRRFMPARPVITIYDEQGKVLRRFGADTFSAPGWCDLVFSPDAARLLAFPHGWPCRGLAGQAFLPADDDARRVYALHVESGAVDVLEFPDAVSQLAVRPDGGLAVGCWNGRLYLLAADLQPLSGLQDGLETGAPCLVDVSRDGRRILAATTDGVVRMLDSAAKEIWRLDLNQTAQAGDKPWARNQQPGKIAAGVWRTNGGLAHSDMGGQYLIEAPDGLILIDPNGGLSFEQNWAKIAGAGLDPRRVRYVLVTHEHGDHAPGAYLWRVATGAQVVAGAEAAYGLQHHLPFVSGYGFHPPNPVDVTIADDRELDLAGLKVRAVRLAGHTYGSMGWAFEKNGTTFVAIGDVIMPGGTLGYSGSLDFSAPDVLSSLRKLEALRPGMILGGHGQGDPGDFVAKGIEVCEATGWAKMTPTKPDPFYAMAHRDYLIAAWRRPIASAVYPDVDGDGRPDVAAVIGGPRPALCVHLNQGGTFRDAAQDPEPELRIEVPAAGRIRTADLNKDGVPDFFVSDDRQVLAAVSRGGRPEYAVTTFESTRATHLLPTDTNGDGRLDLVVGSRFVGGYSIVEQQADGRFGRPQQLPLSGIYFDLQLIDVNGDKLDDLVASNGDILLRQAGGAFAKEPAARLQAFDTWTFMAAADFDQDRKPEIVLLAGAEDQSLATVRVFENTGDGARPFDTQPRREFRLDGATMLRDGPTVADWNADGVPDLVLPAARREGAVILLGGRGGLTPDRTVAVTLDYVAHFDTKLGVADFNGDGRPDLAGFGTTKVGVPGVYIRLQ